MARKAAKIRHFAPFLRFHFVYAKYGYVYLELAVLLEPQFRRPSVGVAAVKGGFCSSSVNGEIVSFELHVRSAPNLDTFGCSPRN